VTTAVCKHCSEQIYRDAVSSEGEAVMTLKWLHSNSQAEQCSSRNGKLLISNAEPQDETIAEALEAAITVNTLEAEQAFKTVDVVESTWRRVVEFVLDLVAWYRVWRFEAAVRKAQIDECAKCPGCGVIAKHEIKFLDVLGKVVHRCPRCTAVWAEQPIVRYDDWRMTLPEVEQQEEARVSREPVRMRTPRREQKHERAEGSQ